MKCFWCEDEIDDIGYHLIRGHFTCPRCTGFSFVSHSDLDSYELIDGATYFVVYIDEYGKKSFGTAVYYKVAPMKDFHWRVNSRFWYNGELFISTIFLLNE